MLDSFSLVDGMNITRRLFGNPSEGVGAGRGGRVVGTSRGYAGCYAAAMLVVLPSYREGLPKVLLEAAACGKAIVATDVPGCREIVRDRFNGLLVAPRDSTALAAAIEELLSDQALREVMGQRSRTRVLAEWSSPRITEQVLGLYRDMVTASAIIVLMDMHEQSAGHRCCRVLGGIAR